jgi:hypothetical protein
MSPADFVRSRVDAGMTVIRGALADLSPRLLLDVIKRATETGSYWIRNQGAHGYINGEILNAHENNEDYEGAQIMLNSELIQKIMERNKEIAPWVRNWDRGYINVRRHRETVSLDMVHWLRRGVIG